MPTIASTKKIQYHEPHTLQRVQTMKILIIGSGGREHAIAWKALQSKKIEHVFVAPGNAGTHLEARCSNLTIDPADHAALISFAQNNEIDLTIIGPEAPLAEGIVDAFQAANLLCFGPTQQAAQLESSKQFCKEFMEQNNIPTADYASFDCPAAALDYLQSAKFPIVIKADGLAAGKGVIIAENPKQAQNAVRDILTEDRFGTAGNSLIIEEFLHGTEVSFIVITDGEHIVPLATSQDHKRLQDGDGGPNTGGMGAYSPAPMVTPELHDKIMNCVIEPTVTAMATNNTPYTGFLYAGLMISPTGQINVLEFNCRLGDPETQPIMMRLESDLTELCLAAVNHQLNQIDIKWRDQCAMGVVMASAGYPNEYPKGEIISGLLQSDSINRKIFHAGTRLKQENIITNGGRVLCATALGDDFQQAQQNAYALLREVRWDNMFYRNDIGHQVVEQA